MAAVALVAAVAGVVNRTLSEVSYVLLLGNALVLVVFLDTALDVVLFFHDAGEADYLPGNAIAFGGLEKEICRRGDHKRGIRRTADQTPAGCQYEIRISTWTREAKVQSEPVLCAYGMARSGHTEGRGVEHAEFTLY